MSIMFGMVVAKRGILMDWKFTLPPTFHKWLTEIAAALMLERIGFARADASKNVIKSGASSLLIFLRAESRALMIHGQFYSYFATPFSMF